jgi:ferrochelatase
MRKAVLLINLGTPDSPNRGDVARYLREFLMDRRVIDIPALPRNLLVKGIIAPFRSGKSSKAYKELWTDRGSPLLYHLEDLHKKIDEALQGMDVYYAMRYQNPSLPNVLKEIEKKAYQKIIVLPLYPQYASSTTGSTIERVMEIVKKWEVVPSINFVAHFYTHPSYINAVVESAKKYNTKDYDKVVFSYHGLPIRHINKSCKVPGCKESDCISIHNQSRLYCYRSACYETTRRIAEKIGLTEADYQVVFQSRLGRDPWLQPYAEETIVNMAKSGIKKLLVFSPAFVSDCLETTIEIAEEYQEVFEDNGGEKIQLVESLNANDYWVNALVDIIKDHE